MRAAKIDQIRHAQKNAGWWPVWFDPASPRL
jgi:hypothetical protein